MRRNGRAVRQSMHEGVLGSMGVISVVAMSGMRKVLHKPIFKVFIHTLRDINPGKHPVAISLDRWQGHRYDRVHGNTDMRRRTCTTAGEHTAAPSSPPASASHSQQRQHTKQLPGPAWLWRSSVSSQ